MIPCGYHCYYYRQEEMLRHSLEEYETIGTRGQQVKETEERLFELYKDPALCYKPEELSKRGVRTIAMLLVSASIPFIMIKKRIW